MRFCVDWIRCERLVSQVFLTNISVLVLLLILLRTVSDWCVVRLTVRLAMPAGSRNVGVLCRPGHVSEQSGTRVGLFGIEDSYCHVGSCACIRTTYEGHPAHSSTTGPIWCPSSPTPYLRSQPAVMRTARCQLLVPVTD